MRFICAKRSCKLSVFGSEYILNPIEYPHVNIHDILAGEYGYMDRTISDCSDIQEAIFEAEKIPGFPERVLDLASIPSGCKLLIMRVGGIGDMIMLIPVLQYMKERLPSDVEVTLCTFHYTHELFSNSGLVDNVVSSPIRLSHLLEYDYYMDFFYDKRDQEAFQRLNMTDYYFKKINIDYESIDDSYKKPILPETIGNSREITAVFDRLHNNNKPIVLANLFASDTIRNFPSGYFEQLVNHFREVFFVVPYKDSFAHIESENVIYLNTSGSLLEYITAIRQSDLVVSTDSSAYHIAAAFGIQAIALFGSVNPEFRVRYYPGVIPLSGQYQGAFCQSPCGMSSAKWIKLDDKGGREVVKRNLYDPDRGCPEAIRNNTEYSPCLLAIPYEKLHHEFKGALERVSGSCATRRSGGGVLAGEKGAGENVAVRTRGENMGKDKNILISACMMVKNEERFLPQCLQSIKEVVDEIVIVDTGSIDRTVEIAKEFGTKVYHHPWEDDFSKHRNQSLSYANGEWLFVIDADEKLDPESIEIVKKNINISLDSDVVKINVRSFMEEGRFWNETISPRFFRKSSGIRYSGIVHNQPNCHKSKTRFLPIVLWHYGYDLGEEKAKEKYSRSKALLKKQLSMTSDNLPAQHHLAITCFAEHDYENALKEGFKALTMLNKRPGLRDKGYTWTYYVVAGSLYKLGRLDECEKIAKEGLAYYEKGLDVYYCLMLVCFDQQRYTEMLVYAEKFMAIRDEFSRHKERFGYVVFENLNKLWYIHQMSGASLLELGKGEEASVAFEKAVGLVPAEDRGMVCEKIGNLYAHKDQVENAFEYWIKVPPEERFVETLKMFGKFLMSRKMYEDAQRIYQSIEQWNHKDSLFHMGLISLKQGDYEQASMYFEKTATLAPSWEENLVNWGVALARSGQEEEAIEKYEQAIEIDPESSFANLNLGLILCRRGEFSAAFAYLKQASKIFPEDVYLHLSLAKCALEISEIEFVVEVCEKVLRTLDMPADLVIESVSQVADLFIGIAEKLLKDKKLESFDVALGLAKQLRPESTGGLKRLSRLAFNLNEPVRGASILETVLSIDPKDPDILSLMQGHIKELEA